VPFADIDLSTARNLKTNDKFLTAVEREASIYAAVRDHSVNRPRTLLADIISNGLKRQTTPLNFERDFSKLLTIEYPIGNVPLTVIDPETVGIADDLEVGVAVKRITFFSPPLSGLTYRVHHTARHRLQKQEAAVNITSVSIAAAAVVLLAGAHNRKTGDSVLIAGSDTVPSINGTHVITVISSTSFSIPITTTGAGTTVGTSISLEVNTLSEQEEEGIGFLGASKGFLAIASKFAHTNDPTQEADAIDYRTKRSEFIRQSEQMRLEYDNILSGSKGSATASSFVVSPSLGLPLERRMSPNRFGGYRF
jgi:hypothetical protein